MDKEKAKIIAQQALSLEPKLISKLGPKLKPYAKAIYIVLMSILVLTFLGAFISLFKTGFSIFVLEVIMIAISGVIVRMFSEYLSNN